MANLSQNQNQTFQTAMLAQVVMYPEPNTFPAQIDPAYAGSQLVLAGSAVKLVDVAGPNIIVTPVVAATDGPIFGFVPYNKRKNQYVAGDTVEVVGVGGVLMLKCNGTVARGDNVSATNPTVVTNDPTIQTTTTTGEYIAGVALGRGATTTLIKVKVAPGFITGSTSVTTAGTP